MTDYKTIRVPEQDFAVAKDEKRDGETWGDYLRRPAGSDGGDPAGGAGDGDQDCACGIDAETADALINEVEEMRRTVKENSQLVNRVARQLEEMQG